MITLRARRSLLRPSSRYTFVTAPQLCTELLESGNMPVSMRAVQRGLNELVLRARRTAKKADFNESYNRKRPNWTLGRRHWTVND